MELVGKELRGFGMRSKVLAGVNLEQNQSNLPIKSLVSRILLRRSGHRKCA